LSNLNKILLHGHILYLISLFVFSPSFASSSVDDSTFEAQSVVQLRPPVGRSSGQPFLQRTSQDELLLSWIEPGSSKRHALRFSVYGGGTWSAPVTVAEGDEFFVNWADVPSVVKLADGRFVAHWLEKSGKATYAYDVRLKISNPTGTSWSNPITPHNDRTQTEHGFVSLLAREQGGVEVVWLDGREMAGTGGHGDHGSKGSMTLRAALLTSEGTLQEEALLDPRVCECCPTSAVRTEAGIIVAYRDRSDEEVRDISVVWKERGTWSEPVRVSNDNWQISGCPVNGPALASRGARDVGLVWFTAAEGKPKVQVTFSNDNGKTFGPFLRIDRGIPLGRVGAAMLSDGSLLASWIEWREEESDLLVRHVVPSGTLGRLVRVSPISSERSSGYPRIAIVGKDVYVAWTEVGKERRVRVVQVPVTEFTN
jgi:hypothetical protein